MVARSLTRTYAVLERRESDAMIVRAGKSEEKAMSLNLSADCKEGEGHGRRREKVYAATREARVAEDGFGLYGIFSQDDNFLIQTCHERPSRWSDQEVAAFGNQTTHHFTHPQEFACFLLDAFAPPVTSLA